MSNICSQCGTVKSGNYCDICQCNTFTIHDDTSNVHEQQKNIFETEIIFKPSSRGQHGLCRNFYNDSNRR